MTIARVARVHIDPRVVLSSRQGHDLAHRLLKAYKRAVRREPAKKR